LLAAVGVRPFVAFWPGNLPRAEEVRLDWHVLLFALAASLVSGLLFGLAPALRAPARQLERTLRAGARTVTGGSRRLYSAFVISEIALSVVLLISAGMLGRTLLRLSSLNPGVNIRNVVTSRMALSSATLSSPARIRGAWQDILDRARRVPGVDSVAMVDTVPMREGNNQIGYWTTPAEPPENQQPLVLANSVTPDYLNVLGMSIAVHGVLAYLTGRRVPEIGVRMALGASSATVMWLVLRQSFGMILAGVVVGLSGALAAARLLERLVTGMRPTDPLTFTVMISVLVIAALFAVLIPARRAARIDPASALRQE
jgi:predicted lysophospholipase L1 biosynthesis ABC-type transport system permease subunit